MTTLADSTNGLTVDGTITFDPPTNWKAAVVNGSSRLFYVRHKTTSAYSTIPVATTILGRNYSEAVPAAGNTYKGSTPAFDADADFNHDGYLNDVEYANRDSAKNARFYYESRLFTEYGEMRFVVNPSSLAYKDWAIGYNTTLLTNNPKADGLFADNSGNNPPGNITNFNLVESTAAHASDYGSVLNAIGRAIAPKWIMANTTNARDVPGGAAGQTYADPVIKKIQSNFEEFGIQALDQTYHDFDGLSGRIQYRATNAQYAVIDSRWDGGLPNDARTQLATLAYYYLLAPTNPSKGALDFFGGQGAGTYWRDPNTSQYNHWTPAAAYAVGTPNGAFSVLTSGPDPQNSTKTYQVYQRWFTGQGGHAVLALYKPLSATANNSRGTLDDATATTVTLPAGTYSRLQADGTLSSVSGNTITLRNGEGAILVQTGMGFALLASSDPAQPSFLEASLGSSVAGPGSLESVSKVEHAPTSSSGLLTALTNPDWVWAAVAFGDRTGLEGVAVALAPLQVLGDQAFLSPQTSLPSEDRGEPLPQAIDLGSWCEPGVRGNRSPGVETPWLADVVFQPFSRSSLMNPEA